VGDLERKGIAEPWFADRAGAIQLFQISRQATLFSEGEPFVDDLGRVFSFGGPVVTGRRYQREWRLGNIETTPSNDAIFGQIGWIRADIRTADRYDEKARRWVDVVEDTKVSARSAFVIAKSGLMGVLQHQSFKPKTTAHVFQELAQNAENSRIQASSSWSVEPVVDEGSFATWLKGVVVTRIKLVVRLPDLDLPLPSSSVLDAMWRNGACVLEEILEASDKRRGLKDLEQDERVNGFLKIASKGFGYVTARGVCGDKETRYDQRERAVQERVGKLPSSWPAVHQLMLNLIRDRNSLAA
jgi:hypothetical protein